MYTFYISDKIDEQSIKLYISHIYGINVDDIGNIFSDKKLTYDLTKLHNETCTPSTEFIQFDKEISVFGAGISGYSTLDYVWDFHKCSNTIVCINAKSIRIDEYIIINKKACYISFNESEDGLMFSLSKIIKVDKGKLFKFWSDKEHMAPEGSYILRDYEWWLNI